MDPQSRGCLQQNHAVTVQQISIHLLCATYSRCKPCFTKLFRITGFEISTITLLFEIPWFDAFHKIIIGLHGICQLLMSMSVRENLRNVIDKKLIEIRPNQLFAREFKVLKH